VGGGALGHRPTRGGGPTPPGDESSDADPALLGQHHECPSRQSLRWTHAHLGRAPAESITQLERFGFEAGRARVWPCDTERESSQRGSVEGRRDERLDDFATGAEAAMSDLYEQTKLHQVI
jgi:hypothetical protein